MSLTIIILFILLGIFLIWLEFFIVPGITIAGIGGSVLFLGGIMYGYTHLERMTAHLILLGALILLGGLLALSFRKNTWKRTALETTIEGTISGIDTDKIKVGDKGKAVSRLAPMGKIMVGDELIEAKSKLGYIDVNEEVVIIEVHSTNVLVEQA